MKKSFLLNLSTVNILCNPQSEWRKLSYARNGIRTAYRQLEVDWKRYNTKDYLFTHNSIVCSVEVEENGYTIKKPCEELINANGNAWKNEVLLNCFKTFIGGENYQEHVQIAELSKGKILDAVIRPVVHTNRYGSANIYVVDILVATNRKHTALIQRIESGELSTLSMGCVANYCQCSICGKVFGDNGKECKHIQYNLGSNIKCEDGVTRKVAELCGACDDKGNYIEDSCQFIEASWVEHPAFAGAVVNYFIETDEEREVRESSINDLTALFNSNLLDRLKVADVNTGVSLRIMKDYLKAEKAIKISKRLIGE